MRHRDQKPEYEKREVAYERVLFFCDAVVAIAITLLSFNLKIILPDEQHLSLADLLSPWREYLGFILSFFNIALYWRTHHDFFIYIKKMDDTLVTFNIGWLLFIVVLPFSTSLLSKHFGDTASVLFYSANVFLISIFQNCIWDYASRKEGFVDLDKLAERPQLKERIQLMLNLDMVNGLIAIVLSFFFPKTAFFLLFFKIPVMVLATIYVAGQRRKQLKGK